MDIQFFRHKAGFTQDDACKLYGVTPKTWRKWETSPTPPRHVLLSMQYLAGYLPGWRGYRIKTDGTIITPSNETVHKRHVDLFWYLVQLATSGQHQNTVLIQQLHQAIA